MDKRFEWFIRDFSNTMEDLHKRVNDLVRDNDFLNKRAEELKNDNEEKDKKLSEKEEEIEKLKNIISNMEDGEGVVDFVNDFIQKDEDLIRIQTEQLVDAQKKVTKLIDDNAMTSYLYSKRCRSQLAMEAHKTPMPEIRKLQGDGKDKCFDTKFSLLSIVECINAWRENICEHRNMEFICVGYENLFKQNDDGTLRLFERNVRIYMNRPITQEDVEGDTQLYSKTLLNIPSPKDAIEHNEDVIIHCGMWRGLRDNRIVVQEDFKPTRDEGSGDLIMNLEDIWYIKRDQEVNIEKRYRGNYKNLKLKPIKFGEQIQFCYYSESDYWG